MYQATKGQLRRQIYLSRDAFAREEGISLVYFAIILMLIIGVAGVAVDGGNAYLERREMQTAADAAAMAGARLLALERPISEVTAEIQSFAMQNGADAADWSFTSANTIQVSVTRTSPTYFMNMGDYDIDMFTVGAVSQAGFEPITTVPDLFPMSVECDCVNYGEVVFTPPVHEYCVENATQTALDVDYGIWLRGVDPTYPSTPEASNPTTWHYAFEDDTGTLKEGSDGTAWLTGTVRNEDGEGFTVDFHFSGRNPTPISPGPKMPGYSVDITNWYYYETVAGTLTGILGGRYDGAEISITGYGPPFQIGVGANMWNQPDYGAASWYEVVIETQPTTGIILNSSTGDTNLRLTDCTDYTTGEGEGETDNCHLQLVDWNGGESTLDELESSIDDPSLSGPWSIGDWVPMGLDASGSALIEVQSSLDQWLGKPVTIALYNEIDEGTQLHICGFAQMVLQSHNLDEGIETMVVDFAPGVVDGLSTAHNGPDFGARDIKIFQ